MTEKLLINQDKSNNFDVKSNKQIEEMAQFMMGDCSVPCHECKYKNLDGAICIPMITAEQMYNAGYRKQSEVDEIIRRLDETLAKNEELFLAVLKLTSELENAKQEVARAIFEEIERECIDPYWNFHRVVYDELKKKYTESEGKE